MLGSECPVAAGRLPEMAVGLPSGQEQRRRLGSRALQHLLQPERATNTHLASARLAPLVLRPEAREMRWMPPDPTLSYSSV
jgi:hypothetical protein